MQVLYQEVKIKLICDQGRGPIARLQALIGESYIPRTRPRKGLKLYRQETQSLFGWHLSNSDRAFAITAPAMGFLKFEASSLKTEGNPSEEKIVPHLMFLKSLMLAVYALKAIYELICIQIDRWPGL